jgi:hypothetical protein
LDDLNQAVLNTTALCCYNTSKCLCEDAFDVFRYARNCCCAGMPYSWQQSKRTIKVQQQIDEMTQQHKVICMKKTMAQRKLSKNDAYSHQ